MKRKRAFVATGVSPASSDACDDERASVVDEAAQGESDRSPRVFRVEAPLLACDELDSPDGAADTPSCSPAVSLAVGLLSTIPTRKPRRRTARAVVTTFVAQHEAAADKLSVAPAVDKSMAVEVVAHAAHTPLTLTSDQRFDALLQRIQRLEHVLSQIAEAHDFDLSGHHDRRSRTGTYQALRATIERRKREAEIARGAEALRAIKWIKRAIGEYGLTVADLGL